MQLLQKRFFGAVVSRSVENHFWRKILSTFNIILINKKKKKNTFQTEKLPLLSTTNKFEGVKRARDKKNYLKNLNSRNPLFFFFNLKNFPSQEMRFRLLT